MKEKFNYMMRIFTIMAALVIAGVAVLPASARLVKCRTDPIFALSNGDVINITLDVNTDATNLRNVSYTIHVPAGVTLRKVTYTAGGIGTKETYKIMQDSLVKTYVTDSLVTTQNTGAVSMVATTRLNATNSKSIAGYTGQILTATVIKP